MRRPMFRDMTLATRLGLGLGVLLLTWAAVLSTAVHELTRAQDRFNTLVTDRLAQVAQVNLLLDRANEISRALGAALLASDIDTLDRTRTVVAAARAQTQDSLDWLRRHQGAPAETRLLDDTGRARSTYISAQDEFFRIAGDEGREPARGYYLDTLLPLQHAYVTEIERLTHHQASAAEAGRERTAGHMRQALLRLVATSALVAAIALLFAFRLRRSITRPLAEAEEMAHLVASGNLDLPPPRAAGGDVGRVLQALHAMAEHLKEDRAVLASSERLFRLLAEHSSDVISLHDADCRYTYLSPACQTLLGRRPEELIGKTPEALVHPDDMPRVRDEHDRLRCPAAGRDYHITFRVLHPDGTERWIEAAGRRISDPGHGSDQEIVSVMRDVSERHEAVSAMERKKAELMESRQQLRDLAAHHEQVMEKRHSHLAREIHDELGQCLTALRMEAALLRTRFGGTHPGIAEHVAIMKRTIDQTMTFVRDVVVTLRPGTLDEGLVTAAEWLLADFGRRTGIAVRLDAPEDDLALHGELATAAFRILQEALTNVGKHARAGCVSVSIGQAGACLRLRIQDDGSGFEADNTGSERTFGLLGMRERALMFSGTIDIDSAPGRGTTLLATLPLQDHRHA